MLYCGGNDEFNVDYLKSTRRLYLYDVYQSKINESDFDTFDLNIVDTAFDQIHTLKYSQPSSLGMFIIFKNFSTNDGKFNTYLIDTGKYKGITITAYSAGHTIG